jgi:hypothetical protein
MFPLLSSSIELKTNFQPLSNAVRPFIELLLSPKSLVLRIEYSRLVWSRARNTRCRLDFSYDLLARFY